MGLQLPASRRYVLKEFRFMIVLRYPLRVTRFHDQVQHGIIHQNEVAHIVDADPQVKSRYVAPILGDF